MPKWPFMKCFTVLVGLLSATPSLADSESQPAPSLVGTWHLVSYELVDDSGKVIQPMGPAARGQIMYDAAGNMSCHLVNPTPPDRPTGISDGAVYEARVSYDRYSSYYGTYEIDTAKREVRHHVIGASMPNWADTIVVRDYVFDSDDELTLSAITSTGASNVRAILKWRRDR